MRTDASPGNLQSIPPGEAGQVKVDVGYVVRCVGVNGGLGLMAIELMVEREAGQTGDVHRILTEDPLTRGH